MLSSPLTSRDRNEFMYKLLSTSHQIVPGLTRVDLDRAAAYCELLSTRQAYGSEANAVSDFQVSMYSRGTRGLFVGDCEK